MSDPVFQTRAELEAWAALEARKASSNAAAMLASLEIIRRVTLSHAHLGGDDATGANHAE